MIEKSENQFALLTFAGLAKIAAEELNPSDKKKIQVHHLPNYDLSVLSLSEADMSCLPSLKTVEDVFWLMGRLPLSKKIHLRQLQERIQKEQLLVGISLKNSLFHPTKPKQPSFNCFVKQDHDYPIYRRTIAQRMRSAVAQAFPKWKIRDPGSIEIWGFYIRRQLHLAFRLSDNRLRYHSKSPFHRPGTLRPTIAASMVRIARLLPNEKIIDPMCGTGIILSEVLHQRSNSSNNLIGGDIDQRAVTLARKRLSRYHLHLQNWDARQLPVEPNSVDCIICNLPFGNRFSSTQENKNLYNQLVTNWGTKLKKKGRMVLLTADTKNLEDVLNQKQLSWEHCCRVKVLGTWASIYLIEPTDLSTTK